MHCINFVDLDKKLFLLLCHFWEYLLWLHISMFSSWLISSFSLHKRCALKDMRIFLFSCRFLNESPIRAWRRDLLSFTSSFLCSGLIHFYWSDLMLWITPHTYCDAKINVLILMFPHSFCFVQVPAWLIMSLNKLVIKSGELNSSYLYAIFSVFL